MAPIHPWSMELNMASSDITLQLISLLEAHVDAWNIQATIVTPYPCTSSLARVLKSRGVPSARR